MRKCEVIPNVAKVEDAAGVKGAAVVCYCKPVTTQKMRYHRLSRRVNNTPSFGFRQISSLVMSEVNVKNSEEH